MNFVPFVAISLLTAAVHISVVSCATATTTESNVATTVPTTEETAVPYVPHVVLNESRKHFDYDYLQKTIADYLNNSKGGESQSTSENPWYAYLASGGDSSTNYGYSGSGNSALSNSAYYINPNASYGGNVNVKQTAAASTYGGERNPYYSSSSSYYPKQTSENYYSTLNTQQFSNWKQTDTGHDQSIAYSEPKQTYVKYDQNNIAPNYATRKWNAVYNTAGYRTTPKPQYLVDLTFPLKWNNNEQTAFKNRHYTGYQVPDSGTEMKDDHREYYSTYPHKKYIKASPHHVAHSGDLTCNIKSVRYIRNGECISKKPLYETVCAEKCLGYNKGKQNDPRHQYEPTHEFWLNLSSGSRTYPAEMLHCMDGEVKKKVVKLYCKDGTVMMNVVRIVNSCICMKQNNAPLPYVESHPRNKKPQEQSFWSKIL